MATTTLIAVRELWLNWEGGHRIDFGDTGGVWRGLFKQPLPSVGNVIVRVSGRLVLLDNGVLRLPTAADVKKLRTGDVEAKARVGGRTGLASSTAHVAKVAADGTFQTETWAASDGTTRLVTLDLSVALAGGTAVTTRVELERIDLRGFLARVDAAEQKKPAAQSRLEFLASVRKVFQGGPDDPLAPLFAKVLYRYRNVAPLFAPGTAESKQLKRYQTLWADGEFVDVSHVLTGIEGSPGQKPDLGQSGFMMNDPHIVVTWSGDLGLALARHAVSFARLVDSDQAPDVQEELDRGASRPDLFGDVDGINLGAAYDDKLSLAQNFEAYYGSTSRKRFRTFVKTSGTVLSRAEIANHVSAFAGPVVFLKYLSQLTPAQSTLVTSIVAVNSPEMDLVVDYFVGFLESGLKRER